MKNAKYFLKSVWYWVRWPLAVLVIVYAALVIYRIPAVEGQQKTATTIATIDAQKITMADVMGTNLPPQPYEPENDATVAGIDANNNGIRDDVELAIFKEYPNDPKIRTAELQYALELQSELIYVFNQQTWVAVAKNEGHGIDCINDVSEIESNNFAQQIHNTDLWMKEVTDLVLNTDKRKSAYNSIEGYETGFSAGVSVGCDIDINSLPQ